jgi:predicted nucleic acid-binding protein
LTLYLDASALVSLFATDIHTPRIRGLIARTPDGVVASEWSLAEFTSALAIGVRTTALQTSERDQAEATLDAWLARQGPAISLEPGDAEFARRLIRSSLRPLRGADALHLAIVQRGGFSLVSFDRRMCEAAVDLGIPVEDLSHP